MKVLHILEATLGGTRRYLQDIIAANVPHEQGLIYAENRADSGWSTALAQAKKANWACHYVDMRRSIMPISDIRALFAIIRIIRAFKPHIIHCHSSKAGALGRIAARLAFSQAKLIYSPHALAHHLGRIFSFIEHCLAPLTTAFCAVSPSERQEIHAKGLASPERIHIVSPTIHAVDQTQDRNAARMQLGIADGAEVIIGVGRLAEQKNPLAFVEILAPLLHERPQLQAYWVGDGQLRDQVIKKIEALNLASRFTITGWSDDVPIYMHAADLVLSTAIYESFGYVAAEALAFGRPVVAANVSGIRDILDNDLSAALYPPQDADQARSLIKRVLTDATFRATLIAAGQEKIRVAYTPATMRQQLERMYAKHGTGS